MQEVTHGDKMNNEIGIKKEIDRLGRIVIPKEMRSLFSFENEVELIVTENGVLIKNPEYKLVRIEEKAE